MLLLFGLLDALKGAHEQSQEIGLEHQGVPAELLYAGMPLSNSEPGNGPATRIPKP